MVITNSFAAAFLMLASGVFPMCGGIHSTTDLYPLIAAGLIRVCLPRWSNMAFSTLPFGQTNTERHIVGKRRRAEQKLPNWFLVGAQMNISSFAP